MGLTEIRWHARGGQGAKTAATFLAEVAIEDGLYSQGFPEYGPERMGAPIRGFTRVSDKPITIHSSITAPDAVVVLDETLLDSIDVAEGLKKDGVILINTPRTPAEVRKQIKVDGQKVYTVNATGISIETIGRPIPNMPMLGALLKIVPVVKKDTVVGSVKTRFAKKFKEAVLLGNINSIERAFKEVQG
jgi:pyruvate ferredoxin oxidoreductase gamma subunit